MEAAEGGTVDAEDLKKKNATASNPREPNVLCCLFVCLCGPTLDALCALPGVVLEDVPASLRATSLVLATILGSPAIRPDNQFVLEQRSIVAIALAAVSFVGMNAAEVSARNADGIFAFVGTLASILSIHVNNAFGHNPNGIDVARTREHFSAACGALLFYIGMRNLRHAFSLPSEVLEFKVSHEDIETSGYAVASDFVVTGNAFAGAATVSFACVLLLNHELVMHSGSAALSNVASVIACFVFLGAFVAQLSYYSMLERLPALFSDSSCDGTYDECEAAYRARRFFTSSGSTALSWVGAIAIATYALAHPRVFRTRRERFEHDVDIYALTNLVPLLSTFAAVVAVFIFVDTSVSMNWSDIELLCLIASIPLSLLGWTSVACFTHVAGQSIYVITRIMGPGYSLVYYTHWSLFASLILVAVVGVLSLFSWGLYVTSPQRLYSEQIETVTAVCITALLSIQYFLTTGTLGMAAGYSGVYYADGKGSWRISGFEFTVQHSISFFFASSLYATRYEHAALKTWTQRLSWVGLPFVLGASWIVAMIIDSSTTEHTPYEDFVDSGSFAIGISVAAVSWGGVGVFLRT